MSLSMLAEGHLCRGNALVSAAMENVSGSSRLPSSLEGNGKSEGKREMVSDPV
jgi:hypothetical protein